MTGVFCMVTRRLNRPYKTLSSLQVAGSGTTALGHDVKSNLLTFVQALQASSLNSADVYENICTRTVGLDETETFLSVKPLNSTLSHIGLLV